MAAYVKFAEMGGARVMAIEWQWSDEKILEALSKLNGFILPGGDVNIQEGDGTLSPYSKKTLLIYNYIKEQNDKGNNYPFWAVCQGIQQLHVLEAPHLGVLNTVPRRNKADPLIFKVPYSESKLFSAVSPALLDKAAKEPYHINYHINGTFVKTYEKFPELGQAFTITATQLDDNGDEYVANIEHKKYPIFGMQHHPEKIPFVMHPDQHIPHERDAIMIVQEYALFFVEECKKNKNQFPTYTDELNAMIENIELDLKPTPVQEVYLFDTQ